MSEANADRIEKFQMTAVDVQDLFAHQCIFYT